MSNKPNTNRRSQAFVAVSLGAVVALAVFLAAALSRGTGASDVAGTGEVNAMGMPVVTTPGSASGTATAGGVEVVGANWHMGRVPLRVAVRPAWTLRNTSNVAVTLGEPRSEVRRGCCPGPFALGDRTLGPGESTELTFELSMHEGMDGPHDLGVHVPVQGPAGPDHLTLSVVGDFR